VDDGAAIAGATGDADDAPALERGVVVAAGELGACKVVDEIEGDEEEGVPGVAFGSVAVGCKA
jgi:hypothetical protein